MRKTGELHIEGQDGQEDSTLASFGGSSIIGFPSRSAQEESNQTKCS